MASFQFANKNLLPPDADASARERRQAEIAYAEYQAREKAKADERTSRFNSPHIFGGSPDAPELAPADYTGPGNVNRETTGPGIGVTSSVPIYNGPEVSGANGAQSSATPPLESQTSQLFHQTYADYMGDHGTVRAAGRALGNAAGNLAAAGQAEKDANAEMAQVTGDKAEALEPTFAEGLANANEHQQRQETIEREARVETDRQMNRVKAAVQSASQMQIKDFWADKTTGARIMGILSQALAGAANGLAGAPGAETPLDRVIKQDFERQKAASDEANTKVYQEKSALDAIHGEVNSKIAAEAAWYLAANEKVKQAAAAINNMYQTPTSKAAMDQLNAKIDSDSAKAEAAIDQHLYDGAVAEKNDDGRLAASLAGQDTQRAIAATKAGKLDKNGWAAPGLTKLVPNSPRTTATYKEVDTIVHLNEGLEGALDALNTGGMKKYYEFMAIHADNFAAGRTYTGAGANLQGPEEGQVNVFAPDYWRTQRANLTPEDAKMQILAAQRSIMRGLRGHYAALDKNNPLDYNDPTVGPGLRNLHDWELQYRKQR